MLSACGEKNVIFAFYSASAWRPRERMSVRGLTETVRRVTKMQCTERRAARLIRWNGVVKQFHFIFDYRIWHLPLQLYIYLVYNWASYVTCYRCVISIFIILQTKQFSYYNNESRRPRTQEFPLCFAHIFVAIICWMDIFVAAADGKERHAIWYASSGKMKSQRWHYSFLFFIFCFMYFVSRLYRSHLDRRN